MVVIAFQKCISVSLHNLKHPSPHAVDVNGNTDPPIAVGNGCEDCGINAVINAELYPTCPSSWVYIYGGIAAGQRSKPLKGVHIHWQTHQNLCRWRRAYMELRGTGVELMRFSSLVALLPPMLLANNVITRFTAVVEYMSRTTFPFTHLPTHLLRPYHRAEGKACFISRQRPSLMNHFVLFPNFLAWAVDQSLHRHTPQRTAIPPEHLLRSARVMCRNWCADFYTGPCLLARHVSIRCLTGISQQLDVDTAAGGIREDIKYHPKKDQHHGPR